MKTKLISKNKKALSAVVGTFLLILLGIATVSTVWITFKSLSDQVLASPEISCFEMSKGISQEISIEKTCYNSETQKLEIKLKRLSQNFQIDEMAFVVENAEETEEWCCGKGCANCDILESGVKTYFLETSEPKEITLKLENCVMETKKIYAC